MEKVKYGPNMGKEFPSLKAVENFEYNGFGVESKEGFAPYEVENLVEWTNDPGIGIFNCTDKKMRFIPTCQLTKEYVDSLPPRPKLEPLKGKGVLFGTPSSS